MHQQAAREGGCDEEFVFFVNFFGRETGLFGGETGLFGGKHTLLGSMQITPWLWNVL